MTDFRTFKHILTMLIRNFKIIASFLLLVSLLTAVHAKGAWGPRLRGVGDSAKEPPGLQQDDANFWARLLQTNGDSLSLGK